MTARAILSSIPRTFRRPVLVLGLIMLVAASLLGQSQAPAPDRKHPAFGLLIEWVPSFAGAARYYDAAGEPTRSVPEVGYNEIGFGSRLTARWAGVGYARLQWDPGWIPRAVLFSGYEKDAKRVSDPWSDLEVAVGVEIAGPVSRVLESERLVALFGPTLTIPFPRPDYAVQAEKQEAGELYIGSNHDLHAWALGVEGALRWTLPVALSEHDEWQLRGRAGWERYLPMPYEESGLEAYRRNEVRTALAEASGTTPHERIDYRNRVSGALGGSTAWRLGSFRLQGSAGVHGWFRQAPGVDGTIVADTEVAALGASLVLDASYELFPRGVLGLSVGGSLPVAGKNSPAEARAWLGTYLRLGSAAVQISPR